MQKPKLPQGTVLAICGATDLFCKQEGPCNMRFYLLDDRIPDKERFFCSIKCMDDYLKEVSDGTWGLDEETAARGFLDLHTGRIEKKEA